MSAAMKELTTAMRQGSTLAFEDTLASRLQAGHEEAADELVSLYADRLLRAATLLLNDGRLAEDAVQETLMTAITRIGQFRGESSLYSWLYTIMMRWCRRQQRRRKIDSFLSLVPSEELAHVADKSVSIEAQWESTEEGLRMSKAVGGLPLGYREVIVLFYYEEFSIPEISGLTGKPVGTVKSLLHRARQKLAQAFEEDE